jgi:hypothetical protein
MSENSDEARNCTIHYDFARKAVLRAHAWSFARKQIPATLYLAAAGTPENPNGVAPFPAYPWLYEYIYPPDCLRLRYQEWPPPSTSSGSQINWTGCYPPLDQGYAGLMGNSATAKKPPFQIAVDQDPVGNNIKVVLSNLENSIFVYTYDSNDMILWDPQFEQAFIWTLAAALCGPLTGDKAQAQACLKTAQFHVNKARVDDANESPTSPEHTPDWIRGRGFIGEEDLAWPNMVDLTGSLPGII